MKIAKYGLDNFLVLFLISLIIMSLSFVTNNIYLQILFLIIGIFIVLIAFWFFRDPERNTPILAMEDQSLVVSPADGKVVEIKDIIEPKLLKSQAVQISIFLSPLDVHINRSPITGKVVHFEYNKGKFYPAYNSKASDLNEHTFVVIENAFGKVAFKQIAGVLARRVVCSLNVNKPVTIGERIGMIKFSSRMDVILPKGSEILVELNQKVFGGETIIARLPRDLIWENFPLEKDND